MPNQICSGLVASLLALALTACGGSGGGSNLSGEVADTSILSAYPRNPSEVIDSGFFAPIDNDFMTANLREGYTIIPNISLIIRRGGENSDNPDGWFRFSTGIEVVQQFDTIFEDSVRYVGILPTTNLGAPLTSPPVNAIWPGHFTALEHHYRFANFYVDFAAGQLGFHNDMDGDDSGFGTVTVQFCCVFGVDGGNIRRSIKYKLDGFFGNHPKAAGLALGQMTGTLSADISDFNDIFVDSARDAILIGLIGEEGAVGVFTDTNINDRDENDRILVPVGGFTATNLSAPLLEAPATAVWSGRFIERGFRDENIDFYIDFMAGQVGFHNGMSGEDSGIGTASSDYYDRPSKETKQIIYTLNGVFGNHPDAKGLNPGQITGTFTSDLSSISQPPFNSATATVFGSIHENGATGTFREIGNDSNDSLTGSFFAINPSYTSPNQ